MASYGFGEKKAIVLGSCDSAVILAKYLVSKGAFVTLADPLANIEKQGEITAKLGSVPVQVICGDVGTNPFEGVSYVFVSESYPSNSNLIEQAKMVGAEVIYEIDFIFTQCDAEYIAVAGTNGKSTTAHLIKASLEKLGKKVFSNIDKPISALLEGSVEFDYVVLVAEAALLEAQKHFRPKQIVMLNLAEEQKDRYPDFERYTDIYRSLLSTVDASSTLILNSQDLHIVSFVQGLSARTLFFGAQEVPNGFEGSWATKKSLFVSIKESSELLSFSLDKMRLRGVHNRENIMAAALSVFPLGVTKAMFQEVLDEVRSLPHRLQFVKRLNSVAFYDDSASTNVSGVQRALQAFTEPVLLIMGGLDSKADYSVLAPLVRLKVKDLILVGSTKEKINRAIGDYTETFIVGTMEEAILIAYQKSRSGDVVLLSPGCDSDEGFADLHARGDFFSEKVKFLSMPRRPNVI